MAALRLHATPALLTGPDAHHHGGRHSPKTRLRRCRWTRPLLAGIGATPHRWAKAASERSRSRFSPTVVRSWPATPQVVDEVHRPVQQEQLGRRGHKSDPLYRIRGLLRHGLEHLSERQHRKLQAGLAVGDPDAEVVRSRADSPPASRPGARWLPEWAARRCRRSPPAAPAGSADRWRRWAPSPERAVLRCRRRARRRDAPCPVDTPEQVHVRPPRSP